MRSHPKIYFYNQKWTPAPLGEAIDFGQPGWHPGHYVWTVKTCRILQDFGIKCELINRLPDEGIVFAHRDHFPDDLTPGPKVLLVCLVTDVVRHPFVQVNVFQNQADPALTRPSKLWPAFFMPLWPESGLIPRDPMRGNRFENICYYGLEERLVPELKGREWAEKLQRRGLSWRIVPPELWHDYSETDAVVAVRSFARRPYYRYPPSKLFNAWIAGVPAILGAETAYQAERRTPLDYIEVVSLPDLVAALHRLQEDSNEREAIMSNARLRAKSLTVADFVQRWKILIEDCIDPHYARWIELSFAQQRAFIHRRSLAYRLYQLQEAGRRLLDKRLHFV